MRALQVLYSEMQLELVIHGFVTMAIYRTYTSFGAVYWTPRYKITSSESRT
jgi:hypothetical protein